MSNILVAEKRQWNGSSRWRKRLLAGDNKVPMQRVVWYNQSTRMHWQPHGLPAPPPPPSAPDPAFISRQSYQFTPTSPWWLIPSSFLLYTWAEAPNTNYIFLFSLILCSTSTIIKNDEHANQINNHIVE